MLAKLRFYPGMHSAQEMETNIELPLETQTYQGTLVFIQRTPENHRGTAKYRMYDAKIE